MGAIKTALPTEGILAVDFNDWQCEREPQLLVPPLETIQGADRAALEEQNQVDGGKTPDAAPKLRQIAGRVGRVVKALTPGESAQSGYQRDYHQL